MADIFTNKDAINLLNGKKILFLGDSNMRATYKDLITLVNRNELTDIVNLRRKGEPSYENDKRTQFSGLIRGRQYVEVRQFNKHGITVEYHFITKCYNEEIINILNGIKDKKVKAPDVIIMNSCLWDITRWGPNGVAEYKENMRKLMKCLKLTLPEESLFIWLTAFPVSTTIRGGLLFKQIDFMQSLLRFEILEANLFCCDRVKSNGFDVLDAHYYLRTLMHWRLNDGIHFGPPAVRLVTNLLLTHIALSTETKLPGRHEGKLLQEMKNSSKGQEVVQLPKIPNCLLSNNKLTTKDKKNSQNKDKWRRKEVRNDGGYSRHNRNNNYGTDRLKENNPWELAAGIGQIATASVLNALMTTTEPFWKDVVTPSSFTTDVVSFSSSNNSNSVSNNNNNRDYNTSSADNNRYIDGNNVWQRNGQEWNGASEWSSSGYPRQQKEWTRYDNRDWTVNGNLQVWEHPTASSHQYNNNNHNNHHNHNSNNNNNRNNFRGESNRYKDDDKGFGPTRRYEYHHSNNKYSRSRPY